MLKNFKQRQQQIQNKQQPQNNEMTQKFISKVDRVERKLDKLMKHLGVK